MQVFFSYLIDAAFLISMNFRGVYVISSFSFVLPDLILPVLQHLFSPSVWNQNPVCSDWLAGRLLWLVNLLEMSSLSRTLCWSGSQ